LGGLYEGRAPRTHAPPMAQATRRNASSRFSHAPIWFQLANVGDATLCGTTATGTMPAIRRYNSLHLVEVSDRSGWLWRRILRN
jgi:hypothetical protein